MEYKQGDTVKIAGVEFVILEVRNELCGGGNALFVMAKEPICYTAFDVKSNNYWKSTLRKRIEKWEKELCAKKDKPVIYTREISLLSEDGRVDYGSWPVGAAPLTLDEYRKYSKVIPLTREAYWLATAYGVTRTRAVIVNCEGDLDAKHRGIMQGVRPAVELSSKMIDEPDGGKEAEK